MIRENWGNDREKGFRCEKTKFLEFDAFKLSHSEDSYTIIVPAMGGMVVECVQKGVKILDFHQDTLDRDTKKVKGGIPILFPFSGPVGKYQIDDKEYEMAQHGFARNMEWKEIGQSDTSVTLELSSNKQTLEQYPYEFNFRVIYKITENGLEIIQKIKNESDRKMPLYPGLHPYFHLPDNKMNLLNVPNGTLDSKDAIDAKTISEVDLNQEGTHKIKDLERNTPISSIYDYMVSFERNDGNIVNMEFSNYPMLLFWRADENPVNSNARTYTCIEPWGGSPGSINSGDTQFIKPGGAATYVVNISLGNQHKLTMGELNGLKIQMRL